MKKILGTIAIVLMLISISHVTPAIQIENENELEEFELKWKMLIAIGIINVSLEEKAINGFALIGFNAGEIIIFEKINIQFEGIPIVVTHSLFYTYCLYKPAEV